METEAVVRTIPEDGRDVVRCLCVEVGDSEIAIVLPEGEFRLPVAVKEHFVEYGEDSYTLVGDGYVTCQAVELLVTNGDDDVELAVERSG
jgi:hypothetical protein